MDTTNTVRERKKILSRSLVLRSYKKIKALRRRTPFFHEIADHIRRQGIEITNDEFQKSFDKMNKNRKEPLLFLSDSVLTRFYFLLRKNGIPTINQGILFFKDKGYKVGNALKTFYERLNRKRRLNKKKILSFRKSIPHAMLIAAYKVVQKRLKGNRVHRLPRAQEIADYLTKIEMPICGENVRKKFNEINRARKKKFSFVKNPHSVPRKFIRECHRFLRRKLKRNPTLPELTERFNKKYHTRIKEKNMGQKVSSLRLAFTTSRPSGVYDKDIISAHSKLRRELKKNPTAREILHFLLQENPNRKISLKMIFNRIFELRQSGRKLILPGVGKINGTMVKKAFFKLRKLGKNPQISEIKEKLEKDSPGLITTRDAIGFMLRRIRKNEAMGRRELFRPRGRDDIVREEIFMEAFRKASLECSSNGKRVYPRVEQIARRLNICHSTVLGVRKRINIKRAHKGKTPLFLQGDLSFSDLYILSHYAHALQSYNGNGSLARHFIDSMGTKVNNLAPLYRLRIRGIQSGLAELPIPAPHSKNEKLLNSKSAMRTIYLYKLWALCRLTMDPKLFKQIEEKAFLRERALLERFFAKTKLVERNPFSGTLLTLFMAMVEGRISSLDIEKLSDFLFKECESWNRALTALYDTIENVLKKSGLYDMDWLKIKPSSIY